MYRNLITVLENEGIKEISPKLNDEFDNALMNAVDTVVDENNVNKVTKIYGLGYKLHDRLIRPAMVQVSVKEEAKKEQNEEKTDA